MGAARFTLCGNRTAHSYVYCAPLNPRTTSSSCSIPNLSRESCSRALRSSPILTRGNDRKPGTLLGVLLRRGIGKDALRYGEGGVGGRNPAVDGAVEQDLPYLVLAQAVTKRRADVNLQLVQAA